MKVKCSKPCNSSSKCKHLEIHEFTHQCKGGCDNGAECEKVEVEVKKEPIVLHTSGAQRSDRNGKGRFDLIPPLALQVLANHYEEGGRGRERNWEKGIPLSRFYDSAMRHGNQVMSGDESENHAGAWAWNVMSYIETLERIKLGILPKELDDMPKILSKKGLKNDKK